MNVNFGTELILECLVVMGVTASFRLLTCQRYKRPSTNEHQVSRALQQMKHFVKYERTYGSHSKTTKTLHSMILSQTQPSFSIPTL